MRRRPLGGRGPVFLGQGGEESSGPEKGAGGREREDPDQHGGGCGPPKKSSLGGKKEIEIGDVARRPEDRAFRRTKKKEFRPCRRKGD